MSENIGATGVAAIETAPAESAQNEQAKSEPNLKAVPAEKAAVAEVRRMKLKVDGREEEVEEAEVIRRAQLSSSASKRMEEVATQKQQIQKLIETLKGNPLAALMDPALGLTKAQVKEQFENWYKREYIDPETLSPEQLKIRDYEAKLKEYEEVKAQQEAQRQQAQAAEQQKHWAGEYERQIVKGLESSGLPKTPSTVKAMAAYLQQAVSAGVDVPIETVADLVRQDKVNDVKHFLGAVDGEALIRLVGDEVVNKIRKADLARLRGQGAAVTPNQAQANSQPKELQTSQSSKPISMADARKWFDKL